MSERRVVITGLGTICPVGNDLKTTWQNLLDGKSGLGPITQFDASNQTCTIAAEIKDFDPEAVVPKAELKRYDRFSLICLKATDEAWTSAGLTGSSFYAPDRMGCILGIGIGGLPVMEANHSSLVEGGPRKVSPFVIPSMIANLAPGNVGIRFGLEGVNYTITSACTSGTHAIGEAYRMIKYGSQDLVVTGGTEACITPLGIAGFARMKALSTRNDDPQKASRPFDRDRDGFVMGEGAGILILEELENAKKRGAQIIAEVVGYGFSCDANHITAPREDGKGAIACMTKAMQDARINPDQIQYVNAHGTSTPLNDPLETAAVKATFGEYAKKGLMVSSTKSMTGHLLGAAGGVEGVFLAMAVHTDRVPPTINLDNPGEGCDLDYVANIARETPVHYAISNSFGFGGTNASIIMKKFAGGCCCNG